MAENESAHFPEHCNHLTRRAALASTAALSAAVLPVGAAVAAAAPDDPGLAVIEAGYREWQGVLAEADRLDDLEGEYRGRAWDRVPPAALPEPEPTPEIAKLWHGPSGLIEEARDPGSYVSIPQDILDQYDAFRAAWSHWQDNHRPRIAAGDPDLRKARQIERRKELLWKRARRLRLKLLKIPTTSPRGLLLKLALTTDTTRLEDFNKRFRRPFYYGTFGGAEDFMQPLLADLRTMAGEALAPPAA